MEEQKITLKIIQMSEVEASEIEWLWYPFIPYGKLTIIQGDPGDGKSTLILNIAARLSRGEGLDEDMVLDAPLNVIYQTAEDGLADTVKPRLESANADCNRISIIDESEKSISMIDERLEQAIEKMGAKLLILDPIQAYLGSGTDIFCCIFAQFSAKSLFRLIKCRINLLSSGIHHRTDQRICPIKITGDSF